MTEVSSWETICDLKDLIPGVGVRAYFGGKQVAIFSVSEKLYAVDAIDPFTGAAVLSRGITGSLSDQPVVASPIYKQHFNLETGQCLEDDTVAVMTFPVRENEGSVQLGQL